MNKRFRVFVEIETLDDQTFREAMERLHRWLETFGHTASGHGFEFLEVSRGQEIKQ